MGAVSSSYNNSWNYYDPTPVVSASLIPLDAYLGGTGSRTYRLYRDTASPYNVGEGTLQATSAATASGVNAVFSGLAAGYYWVQATDANGCLKNTGLFTL
jgi:hypothetical protein